jgi:hypothetical protein
VAVGAATAPGGADPLHYHHPLGKQKQNPQLKPLLNCIAGAVRGQRGAAVPGAVAAGSPGGASHTAHRRAGPGARRPLVRPHTKTTKPPSGDGHHKVANRNVWVSGGAHEAISRRPPIYLVTTVARTEGYTYAAKVWDLSIVQGPFSVAPCRTLALRFATLSSLYGGARWRHAGSTRGTGSIRWRTCASRTGPPSSSSPWAPTTCRASSGARFDHPLLGGRCVRGRACPRERCGARCSSVGRVEPRRAVGWRTRALAEAVGPLMRRIDARYEPFACGCTHLPPSGAARHSCSSRTRLRFAFAGRPK